MKNSALDQVKDLVALRQGRTDHKLRSGKARKHDGSKKHSMVRSRVARSMSQHVAECTSEPLRHIVVSRFVSLIDTNRSSARGRSCRVHSAWWEIPLSRETDPRNLSRSSRDIIHGYVAGISSEFHSRSDPASCTSPSLRSAKRRIPPSRIHHADRGIGPTWVVPVLRKQSARRADASLCPTIRYIPAQPAIFGKFTDFPDFRSARHNGAIGLWIRRPPFSPFAAYFWPSDGTLNEHPRIEWAVLWPSLNLFSMSNVFICKAEWQMDGSWVRPPNRYLLAALRENSISSNRDWLI